MDLTLQAYSIEEVDYAIENAEDAIRDNEPLEIKTPTLVKLVGKELEQFIEFLQYIRDMRLDTTKTLIDQMYYVKPNLPNHNEAISRQ